MKNRILAFDVLRGLGIFMVVILHTAFYYYDGIYDIDLNNPSLLVTIIGFLLMFAGLFAMLSGTVHTLQYVSKRADTDSRSLFGYLITHGLILLGVAYFYFLVTGPGIIDFAARSMDESLLVAYLNGRPLNISQQRLLYVDSLVMLALNVMLLAVVFRVFDRFRNHRYAPLAMLVAATVWMAFSVIRIPLYPVYLEAVENNQYGLILALNWFVAKNNPILPFFAFALMGSYVGLLIVRFSFRQIVRRIVPVASVYIVLGVVGYILSPETMLERDIDLTWYFIMVIQVGLFLLMMLGALALFDGRGVRQLGRLGAFFARFGVAGLTVFVFESVLAAGFFRTLQAVGDIRFGMGGALFYGFYIAVLWGVFLFIWEDLNYRFGIEYWMTRLLSLTGKSTKAARLKAGRDATRRS